MRASDRMFDAFWDVQKEFFILPACWDIFSAVMLQNAGIRAPPRRAFPWASPMA
jgi:hypothetical protein